MKRVCIISEREYGSGAAIAAFRLACALADRGHEAHFLYTFPCPGAVDERVKKHHLKWPARTYAIERAIWRLRHWLVRRKRQFTYQHPAFVSSPDYPYVETTRGRLRSPGENVLSLILIPIWTLTRVLPKSWRKKIRIPPPVAIWAMLDWCAKQIGVVAEKVLFGLNGAELKRALGKIRPDVINFHNMETILRHDQVMDVAKQHSVVMTMHDNYFVTLYHNQWESLSGQIRTTWGVFLDPESALRKLRAFLDHPGNIRLVCPSDWLSQRCLQASPSVKVQTIPNGVDPSSWSVVDNAKEQLGLDLQCKYVLFICGRLNYDLKNFQLVAQAIDHYSNSEDLRVMAIGEADEEFKAANPSVRFFDTEFSPEALSLIYSAADALLIPSLVENSPNTILESYFCGRPVVGANVGGIPELIQPEQTGWLFDPRDLESLTKALDKLIKCDEKTLESMKSRCISTAQEKYTLATQAEAYEKVFFG